MNEDEDNDSNESDELELSDDAGEKAGDVTPLSVSQMEKVDAMLREKLAEYICQMHRMIKYVFRYLKLAEPYGSKLVKHNTVSLKLQV